MYERAVQILLYCVIQPLFTVHIAVLGNVLVSFWNSICNVLFAVRCTTYPFLSLVMDSMLGAEGKWVNYVLCHIRRKLSLTVLGTHSS